MLKYPEYIKNTEYPYPIRILWKKIIGPKVSLIQISDAIYDRKDLDIRKMTITNYKDEDNVDTYKTSFVEQLDKLKTKKF